MRIYILLTLLLCAALAGAAKNLSRLPATSSNHPSIATRNGEVMVVWREQGGNTGQEKNIYYTAFRGDKTWSFPRPVHNTPVFSKNPHIAWGSDGVIHLVWAEGNSRPKREIMHSTYDGTWSHPIRIYNSPNNSNWPRVALIGGTPTVIWTSEQGNTNTHYIIRNNWQRSGRWDRSGAVVSNNTKWTGETSLATHNDLVCHGDTLYAVWQQGTEKTKSVYFSQNTGAGAWSAPFDISPGRFASYPAICIDPGGTLHVIASGLRGRVWHFTRSSNSWKVQQLNHAEHVRGFVDIAADITGGLHTVYRVNDSLAYAYRAPGAAWKEQVLYTAPEVHFPAVCVGRDGYVHIVAGAEEGQPGDILYTRLKAFDPIDDDPGDPGTPPGPGIDDPGDPGTPPPGNEPPEPETPVPPDPKKTFTERIAEFLEGVSIGYKVAIREGKFDYSAVYMRISALNPLALIISNETDAGLVIGIQINPNLVVDFGASMKLPDLGRLRGPVSILLGISFKKK